MGKQWIDLKGIKLVDEIFFARLVGFSLHTQLLNPAAN